MPHIARSIARRLLLMTITVLLAAFLAACLVRMAPGFASDPNQLDPRLSAATIQALRAERTRNGNVVSFYFHYLSGAVHGELGRSQLFHRPAVELIRERAGTTAKLVIFGLFSGWTLALALASAVLLLRHSPVTFSATLLAGFFLCVPAAVLALAFVLLRAPAWLAIALVVFPKIFSYARNLLVQAQQLPHVITARAKGLGPARVLAWHILPVTAAQTIALAGISVSMAVGAAIPIESLLSIPGLGQLAWEAALGRDLPLLVGITLVVVTVTLAANAASDFLSQALRSRILPENKLRPNVAHCSDASI
jgi:peptide/nickel transport system permease protein